jgi:opacity protein-like surface antigen
MSFIKIAVLAGVASMAASATMAADPSHRLLPPVPVIADTTETWYLRGDVGYVDHKRPEADFAAAPSSGNLVREGLGDTAVVGFGIGYRFSPLFRADVTLDHRFNTRFKGVATAPDFATGSMLDKGRFQSSTLMLNGYVDLGTYRGLTPYVGAGVGVAQNVISNYTRTAYDDLTGLTSKERLAGDNDYSLAWALMAGVGYKLSSNFMLDLGYRYVSLGDVKTRYYGGGAGADVESIGAHEVRLGVRYALQ